MEVKINSKEIAEAIAEKVAQLTPLFSVMDVVPVGGAFDGETVCIPLEAETIYGLRELTETYDEAAMRVTSAAVAH